MENNSTITHPVQTVSVRYCMCVVYVCVVSAVRYYYVLCSINVVLKCSGTVCVFLHVYVWCYVCVVSSVLNYDIIRVQSNIVLGRQGCSLLG